MTVNFATVNGTATAGSDFARTGNLTFTAGQTTKTISVTVIGDTPDEPNEIFLVNLSAPSSATIADGQGRHHHRRRPGAVALDQRRHGHGGQLGHPVATSPSPSPPPAPQP